MQTSSVPAVMHSPTVTLRELADRLLKSCTRRPVDIDRWAAWRASRRDLSFEMVDNALLAGGNRQYARALYLQKAAELVEDDSDVPPVEECQRLVTEADLESDRALRLALLDGKITPVEQKEIEIRFTNEVGVLNQFIERFRRVVQTAPQHFGARTW